MDDGADQAFLHPVHQGHFTDDVEEGARIEGHALPVHTRAAPGIGGIAGKSERLEVRAFGGFLAGIVDDAVGVGPLVDLGPCGRGAQQ